MWGIRLQELCPAVSPGPCMSPAGHCKHSMDSGGAQPGQLRLGIMFSVCGCAVHAPASHRNLLHSPGTRLSLAHTHRHGAFQLFDDQCQSFPVLRTDGAAWCPHKAMTSPCPARHPLPPRSVPSSPLRSQQTTTALGCNLLALTVAWSRLGTAGILGAGVLWCPAGTRVGWEC